MTKLSEITGDSTPSSGGSTRLSQVGNDVGPEPTGMEKFGAAARGVASGALGGIGDIEAFATQTVPQFFGFEGETGEDVNLLGQKGKTFFPTSEQVEKAFQAGEKFVGAKPGVRPELEGYRSGGEFVGGFLTPSQIAKNLVKKPIEKGMQVVSRARGKEVAKGVEELEKGITRESEKVSEKISERAGKEEAKVVTDAQRREINLRDASKRFDKDAQLAKAESKTALNKVGPVSNEAQVGEGLRQTVVGTEKRLSEAASKEAERLKGIYFSEGKAQEKAGRYWSQSQTGQEFLKYLKDVMNPANSGKYTQYEISAAQDLARQLSGVKVKGQVVRSEIEKIEKIIRDTKKLPNQPTATGADALKQQYMGKLARKLEDSVYGYADEGGRIVEGFAPTGRVFRETYRTMMQPLDAYESQVGKVLTQQLEGVKGVFTSDVTAIPGMVFKSPQQVQILEKMGVSRKALEKYAGQHAANELSKLNTAEGINAWINSSAGSYLKEFPEVAKKVQEYAKTFERNEATIAKKAEGAKALEKKAKEIVSRRDQQIGDITKLAEKDRELVRQSTRDIFNATTREKAVNASERYIKDLDSRGLISPADTEFYLGQIKRVREEIVEMNKAKTALKGILPWVGAAVGAGAVGGYSLNKLLGGL